MPSLGMKGPFPLTPEKVDELIRGSYRGNFAVGYMKENGAFVVRYIGRADNDLAATLKAHPADPSTKFKFSIAENEKVAFDKQCKTFHDFGGLRVLENEEHPQPPNGTGWKCPVCDELG